MVNLLLELYTPSDVRVVLDESFASESEAVRLPYYIQEGQIYYNLNRVDGDENFRQPTNEPRIKWQRVTESEISLTLVYPVNVKDDDGKPIRTEIFEEVYTFYKTSNGWKLKPNSNEKSYVWSSEDEVWKAQAHVVTPDQVDQWVMSLDKHLADYPEQNEVYETFYQEAHMMSYDNKYFEAEGNDTSGFDVLVFNGDESLMNLEVGEDIGDYRTTESLAGTLIYGVGPETYVVQKKLSDGEVSYEERPYEFLTVDIENYIFNFIERRRAGVIALIGYDDQDLMKSADYYYMDEENQMIRISYDSDRIYRVYNDVTAENDYKE